MSREVTASRNEIVSSFNKLTFGLLTRLKEKCPGANIDRVEGLVKIAKRADHEVIMTEMGPYVFKYRKLIAERKIEAFDSTALDKEIKSLGGKRGVDKYKEMIVDMFNVITESLKVATKDELEFIYSTSDTLIDLYIDFCIKCRTEAKS
jgi:hypothetical protein